MSLSIVSSLFGMTGGVKFTFIWSKLLHFPMLVIPQVAQAPTVSLRKCAIFLRCVIAEWQGYVWE